MSQEIWHTIISTSLVLVSLTCFALAFKLSDPGSDNSKGGDC